MQIFIATEVTRRRQDPIQPGPACPRQKKKKRQDMEQKTRKKLTIRSTPLPPPPLPDGLKRFRRWIVTHAPDPSNPTKNPRRDMLGANTRPRHHPESRVQRHRFRVGAAAKTLAARDGDEGRREAQSWAQRNRHHDDHAVVALHVLAFRVGARLPLILAHHHPRIPVRARRQRAA